MDRALDSDSKGRWFESSRAYQSRQGTRRRMERFCDGFLAAFNGGNGGKCCKICKMGTTDQAQTACLCPCGKLSCFYGAMRSFLWTRGSEKLALFPFLPESFLEDDLLWFFGTLARQHCARRGHPRQSSHRYQAVDTGCPFRTLLVSRLRYSFLLRAQVKQSSTGSYSMFSMRPTCLRNLLTCLLLVIVGGLYEVHLAIQFQI